MRGKINFRKAIVVLVLVALLAIVFVGCTRKATDDFNQFVPPPTGNQEQGEVTQSQGVKQTISGTLAATMLYDSIIAARSASTSAANIINFSFSPYFTIDNNGSTKKYTLRSRGAIDTENNDNSVFIFEILKSENGGADEVVLGFYGKNGNIYIAKDGDYTRQYLVDDMDISLIVGFLDEVLNRLDLGGFISRFDIGELIGSGNDIVGFISGIVKLDGTLLELIFSLFADTCYMTDYGNGTVELDIPTKLTDLLGMLLNDFGLGSLITDLLNGLTASAGEAVGAIVDFLIGDILSGSKKLSMDIAATIQNNKFNRAEVTIGTTENSVENNYTIGVGEIALSSNSGFRAETLTEINTKVDVADVEYANYGFTTLSADIELDLDLGAHQYSLSVLDTALGGMIGDLLGAVDNEKWNQTNFIDITSDTKISLLVSLRAEIDLRNNDNTRILLELRGSEDNNLRLGAYYKGADNALYIDLAGMGGGQIKVDSYDHFVLADSVDESWETVIGNARYVATADGYRLATAGETGSYVKVERELNLNKIIVEALYGLLPQIPSLLELVNGAVGASAAESDEVLAQMIAAIESGKLAIPHMGIAANKAGKAAADEESSVDVMCLITGILGVANLETGDSILDIQGLYIYMTQSIIDTIFKDALGLNLPITRLDLELFQTDDEGWKLNLIAEMSRDSDGDGTKDYKLLGLELGIYINYGNPDEDFRGTGKTFVEHFDAISFTGFIDTDFFSKNDSGELDNLFVNVGLDANIRFSLSDGAEFDLSPIGAFLYGLTLKLQGGTGDNVANVDLGISIDANVNISTIIGLVNGTADVAALLSNLDARITIVNNNNENLAQGEYSVLLLLENGIIYIDAPGLGLPKYQLSLSTILGGGFKLFGTASAMSTDATASYVYEEEKAEVDTVGLILALLGGVKIGNTYDGNNNYLYSTLEVIVVDNLFAVLFEALGVAWPEEYMITTEGTSLSLQLDGLNLSELWLDINLALQQGEGNELGLGLGLGHIAIGAGRKDLSEGLDKSQFGDLLNGANIVLGAEIEIDVFVAETHTSLDNLLGALLYDAQLAGLDINLDEINGGLNISLLLDLDISSPTATNDTNILIEIRKVSDGSVFLGLYYQHLNGKGTLYLYSDGSIIRPVAVELDLISLIYGLIYPAESSAMATDATASAVDLSNLNPLLLISDAGIQLSVMGGITELLLGLIVGDFNDYIDYENSYKYVEAADGEYQKSFTKYAYVDGSFVPYDVDAHTGLTVYAKVENGHFIRESEATDAQKEIAVGLADESGYKLYAQSAMNAYVEITDANYEQYKSAEQYIKLLYVPASELVATDADSIEGYGADGFEAKYADGLTAYAQLAATEEDKYFYDIYSGKEVGGVKLNIPEIGAVVSIGRFANSLVSSTDNGRDFGGIGIGVFLFKSGTPVADRVSANAVANLAIKIGNIVFTDAKFAEANQVSSLAEYITTIIGPKCGDSVSLGENFEDLTVYIRLEGALALTAYGTEGESHDSSTSAWDIGSVISAFAGGLTDESTALGAFLKNLMVQFNVLDTVNNITGFRIAGNIAIGGLFAGGETLPMIMGMLAKSDLVVELYDNYVDAAGAHKILGLYITDGWIYVNIDGAAEGSLIGELKFKISLNSIMALVAEEGGALATAGSESAQGVISVAQMIGALIDSIDFKNVIDSNDNSELGHSLKISLGAQFLSVLVGLIADVEGVQLPALTPENSYIEINSGNPSKLLTLALRVDPVGLEVSLGNLQIGVKADENVDNFLAAAELNTYQGLADLETLSLNLELGIDFGISEGIIPLGDIVTVIAQQLGADIAFPLDIDVIDAVNLQLKIRITGNINLKDLNKSEIALEIRNEGRESENKVVLGLYIMPDYESEGVIALDGNGKAISNLYIEANFTQSPAKWKVANFNLLDSLLADVLETLFGAIGAESTALATEDAVETNPIIALGAHNIKIMLTDALVNTLLDGLLGDTLSADILGIIKGLGLNAEVEIGTQPIKIAVKVDSTIFNLGIAINEPQITATPYSYNKVYGHAYEEGHFAAFVSSSEALSLNLGLAISYDLSNGVYALDSLLADLSNLEALQPTPTVNEDGSVDEGFDIGSLFRALTADVVLKNTKGVIGVNVVLNVLAPVANTMLPQVGAYLASLLKGTLDPSAVTTAPDGTEFNAIQLLQMVEAGIFINLNGSEIAISLIQDGGKPYLCFALEGMGADNFKVSLDMLINRVGEGSSAMATEAVAAADTSTINKVLNNLFAGISIGKGTGLDLIIAPYILQMLIADLLSSSIGIDFSEKTLDMFVLSEPYVKAADYTAEGYKGLPRVGEYTYITVRDTKLVEYNENYTTHAGLAKFYKNEDGEMIAWPAAEEFLPLFAPTMPTVVYKASTTAIGGYEQVSIYAIDGETTYYKSAGVSHPLNKTKLYVFDGESYVRFNPTIHTDATYPVYERQDSPGTLYVELVSEKVVRTSAADYAGGELSVDGMTYTLGDNTYDVLYQVEHSGISWSKSNGIGINLLFADGFGLKLGLDGTLSFAGNADGTKLSVLPAGLDASTFTTVDELNGAGGTVYISLDLSLGLNSDGANSADLKDLISALMYDPTGANDLLISAMAGIGDMLIANDFVDGLSGTIRITIGANIDKLIAAISGGAQIAEILSALELAIESVDNDEKVLGGIYLYQGNLIFDYQDEFEGENRENFAMSLGELFAAIGASSSEEISRTTAAMLQVWVGEYISLGGIASTGLAVKITSTLVDTLLGQLVGDIVLPSADGKVYAKSGDTYYDSEAEGFNPANLDENGAEAEGYDISGTYTQFIKTASGKYVEKGQPVSITEMFGGIGLEVSLNMGAPTTGIDGKVYAKSGDSYYDISAEGFDPANLDGSNAVAEGYNAMYGIFDRYILVKEAVTVGEEAPAEYALETYQFRMDTFALSIAGKVGMTNIWLTIGNIKIGLAYAGDEPRVVVPDSVKATPIPEESIIEIGLDIDLGIAILGQNNEKYVECDADYAGVKYVFEDDSYVEYNSETHGTDVTLYKKVSSFDIGALIDRLIGTTTIGQSVLDLIIPDGGRQIQLTLSVELALNLSRLDSSIAEIALYGNITEADGTLIPGYENKLLLGAYFKDGELLVDLSGIGFGKAKILGLQLSKLLNVETGFELIASLLNSSEEQNAAGTALSTEFATAAENGSPAAYALMLLLNDDGIKIEIADAMLNMLLNVLITDPAQASLKETLSKLGIGALVTINTKPLYIELNAVAADLLGINVKIGNIRIGNLTTGGTTLAERVAAIDAEEYPDALELVFGTGVSVNILLESLSVSLKLDINAILSDEIYEGLMLIGNVGEDIKGLSIEIKADLDLGGIIDATRSDNYDIVADILPYINAEIAINNAAGERLLAIYLYGGNVILQLENMGLANIQIENDFLSQIVSAVSAGSSALATENAEPAPVAEESTLTKILGTIVDGVYLADKAVTVALTNDYIIGLLNTLLGSETVDFGNILPALDSSVVNGVKLNLKHVIESDVPSGETKQGLLQVDLSLWATHLNIDLFMPEIIFNAPIIGNPALDVVNAEEVTGLSLALRGQLKIDQNDGVALANILSGIVGDLKTTLVIEDGLDIRFEIGGALEFSYDIDARSFGIDALSLKIGLYRYYEVTDELVSLAEIFYADGAIYLDLSHFFANQEAAADTVMNYGKLKITGINIEELLSGLLGGASSAAEDDGSMTWAYSNGKLIYVPATADSAAAPQLYAKTENAVKGFEQYAESNDIYAISGEYVKYDAADPTHAPLAACTEDGATLYYSTADGAYHSYYPGINGGSVSLFTHSITYQAYTGDVYVRLIAPYSAGSLADSPAFDAAGNALYVNIDDTAVAYVPSNEAHKGLEVLIQNASGAYVRYTGVYVNVGGAIVPYEASNAAHQGVQSYDAWGNTLYVIVFGSYVPRITADSQHERKISYTQTVVEYDYIAYDRTQGIYVLDENDAYVVYDEAVHAGVTEFYDAAGNLLTVNVYNTQTVQREYIPFTNSASQNAPVQYVKGENGNFIIATAEQLADVTIQKYVKISAYAAATIISESATDSLLINISGKVISELLAILGVNLEGIDLGQMLETVAVSLNIDTDPQTLGIGIDILDKYNNYSSAFGLELNIFGFDHEAGRGSEVSFYTGRGTVPVLAPADISTFRQFLDLDLVALMSAADVMDVLWDALKFNSDAIDNETVFLNAEIALDMRANVTDGQKSWVELFASLLGLKTDELQVLIDVLYLDSTGEVMPEADSTTFEIGIEAAINAKNLIGGLIDGSGLNLAGTEIRLTLKMNNPHLAESIRDAEISITVIGQEESGLTGIYIDLSGYRGKGKHKVLIDLAGLIGGTSSTAIATADNTGILGGVAVGSMTLFDLLNALLGEIKLADGKLNIGLADNFLGGIMGMLGASIPGATDFIKGGLYLDIRNLGLGLDLYLGEITENADGTTESDVEFYLNIGNINFTRPATYRNGSFLSATERADFKNLRDLTLDIDITGSIHVEGEGDSTDDGVSLNPLVSLISGLLGDAGTQLFQNPNFRFLIGDTFNLDYTLRLNVHLDLADFSKTQIAIEMYKIPTGGTIESQYLHIALYLDAYDLYIDLSGLGIPKLKIEGINLGAILDGALTEILDTYLISDEAAQGNSGNSSAQATAISPENDFLDRLTDKNSYASYVFGTYVMVGDTLVLYDSSNAVHQGLAGFDAAGNALYVFDIMNTDTSYSTYIPSATSEQAFIRSGEKYVAYTGYYVKVDGVLVPYDATNLDHQSLVAYNALGRALYSRNGQEYVAFVPYTMTGDTYIVSVDNESDNYQGGLHLLAGIATPYFLLVDRNNSFGFGFNIALINSLLETMTGLFGTSIELPDLGDLAIILDSTSDTLVTDIILQTSENYYMQLTLDEIHINGNLNSAAAGWNTASDVFARLYSQQSQFTSVYDVESGEVTLERINLGLDLKLRMDGNNTNGGAGSFEEYLQLLVGSLLGSNSMNVKINLPTGTSVLGYDLVLRASLNVKSLVGALNGHGNDWWSDIELYVSLTPNNGSTSYGTLLKVYKQSGDSDVYVDLSPLGLPKIRLFGLGGLIGGLIASGDAMATSTEEASGLGAIASALTDANLTATFMDHSLKIEIGMGVIEGILNLLTSETLAVTTVNAASGTEYMALQITDAATGKVTTIPLPRLSANKAISLELVYADYPAGKGIGLNLGLGLDNSGNNLGISIDNLVIGVTGENVTGFVNTGNKGENVFGDITGTNRNSFSGLVLNDGMGISLMNILSGVIDAINPNITIQWNKNTAFSWERGGDFDSSDATIAGTGAYTTIALSRTTSSSTASNGNTVGAGKIFLDLDFNPGFSSEDRSIGVWLYNNKVVIDLGRTLSINLSGISALTQMEVTELDILSLISGLGASDEEGSASSAVTTEGGANTAADEEESSILSTLTGIIGGIELNWWYNPSVVGKGIGSNGTGRDISTIRIDINPAGFNDILVNLYYTLYCLDNETPAISSDEFGTLTYNQRYFIVTGAVGANRTVDGRSLTAVDAYGHVVMYMQRWASTLIGELTGVDILRSALAPGGIACEVLRDILGSLLPLPFLENGKDSFIEIVFDKSRAGNGGVLSEIGVYINKAKSAISGSNYSHVNVNSVANSAEIIISLSNGLNFRSVSSVTNYDTGAAISTNSTSTVVSVDDPSSPVELTAASLAANTTLLQRVNASFYGLPYTSKGGSGTQELGGTAIVWDTSTVNLVPGATSTMTGYALNYPVTTVTVRVSNRTEFNSLYGYVKDNGTFVQSSRITIDPTKDPRLDSATTLAQLPTKIVILRRDGEMVLLDSDYDSSSPAVCVIDGRNVPALGKFGWNEPATSITTLGGTMPVNFWYQVGNSSRIEKQITVTYNNMSVVGGLLPSGEMFDILSGGSALDFDFVNMDVKGNLGLPAIPASSITAITDAETGVITYTYIDSDGSRFTFVPSTEKPDGYNGWTDPEKTAWDDENAAHIVGLSGTFTRENPLGDILEGTYEYRAAADSASGGGLLDSILGLLGGLTGGDGEVAAVDNGDYALTVTTEGYSPVTTLTVLLENGRTSTVDVLEWKYDLTYDMTKPQNGLRGSVIAVINRFERQLLSTSNVVTNSKQEIEIDVSVARYVLDRLVEDSLAFNQYGEMFTKLEEGTAVSAYTQTYEYVEVNYFEYTGDVYVSLTDATTNDVSYAVYDPTNGNHVAANARFTADGKELYVYAPVDAENWEYVVYDIDTHAQQYTLYTQSGAYQMIKRTGEHEASANEYVMNVFTGDSVDVRIRTSAITTRIEAIDVGEFYFYNIVSSEGNKMFVVPEMSGTSNMNIAATLVYEGRTDAYDQEIGVSIRVTPKTAERAIVRVQKGATGALLEATTATVYFTDGTVLDGVAIGEYGSLAIDTVGVKLTTTTVGVLDSAGLWIEGYSQTGVTLEVRVY